MTRPLAAVERLLERLFERPAARLFHTSLQPIQIQRKLERAMDTGRVFSGDHAYVPTRYRVRLSPDDAQGFDGYRQTLEAEFADALHARARARGYRLLARPTVAIEASARIQPADIHVVADVIDQSAIEESPGQGGRQRGPHGTGMFGADAMRAAPVVAPAWAPQQTMSPPFDPDPAPPSPATETPAHPGAVAPAPAVALALAPPVAVASAAAPAWTAAMAPTESVPAPAMPPPLARVELRTRGAFVGACEFRSGTARIGRSTNNDIVLADDRVSRRHGQLSARQGNLVFTDLGSTNGSFVNGTRVREIVLGSGDVVRLGNSTLTIQPHA